MTFRTLLHEEFHNLYRSPNIVKIVKSRRLCWTRHAARMRKKKNV
jgi:hypothetical protein